MTIIVDNDLPAQLDWTVFRGNTFLKEFNIKEGGVLMDLTGVTFSMPIVDNRGVVQETLTLGSGITVVSTGRVRLHATAAETATWTNTCPVTFALKFVRPTTPVIEKTLIIGPI